MFPFLKSGLTIASLNFVGKIPYDKLMLYICARGLDIKTEMFFSNLTVILSKPEAVSSFKLFIKSIISLLSTGHKNEASKDVSYGLLDSIGSVLLI